MTEEKLQSECTTWFWNTYPSWRRMLFHVDNNSYNATIGARKKALGVVQGVSDLILVLNGNVVFIEMKIPGGLQKPEQKDFETKVVSRNHLYIIIYTVEQFKEFIWQVIGKS